MIAIGDTLYFWRSPGSNVGGLDFQRLYRSTDEGATWLDTGVEWSYRVHRIGLFAVLQFGRGYAGARDGFVYVYATRLRSRVFATQRPGEIYLLRVPRDAIFDAPEPWGPWTTVLYTTGWPPEGGADEGVFFANFSPKWWSDDGRRFVLVFTGTGRGDAFQSVAGTFRIRPGPSASPTPGADLPPR